VAKNINSTARRLQCFLRQRAPTFIFLVCTVPVERNIVFNSLGQHMARQARCGTGHGCGSFCFEPATISALTWDCWLAHADRQVAANLTRMSTQLCACPSPYTLDYHLPLCCLPLQPLIQPARAALTMCTPLCCKQPQHSLPACCVPFPLRLCQRLPKPRAEGPQSAQCSGCDGADGTQDPSCTPHTHTHTPRTHAHSPPHRTHRTHAHTTRTPHILLAAGATLLAAALTHFRRHCPTHRTHLSRPLLWIGCPFQTHSLPQGGRWMGRQSGVVGRHGTTPTCPWATPPHPAQLACMFKSVPHLPPPGTGSGAPPPSVTCCRTRDNAAR